MRVLFRSRFERGVDFQSITDHMERMTRLIIDICGRQAGPLDDQVINLPERKPVSMRLDRCHRVLGVLVTRQEVEGRSEEHTSELQSLMRISYAVFCLKKKKQQQTTNK